MGIPDAENSNPNIPTTSNFSATAEKLKAEFPGSGPELAAEGNSPQLPAGEVIPPETANVIPPKILERYYRIFFDGMHERFGDRWDVDDLEVRIHAQLAADAGNELAPLWFANTKYKATVTWIGVTALMVLGRSDAGIKIIEKLTDLATSLFAGQKPEQKPAEEKP